MTFLISVRGDRFTGTYVSRTAVEAVAKAERHVGARTVTITHPLHVEWPPEQFQLMITRWTPVKLTVV